MNKNLNTWEELDTKWIQENLEKTKSGSIAYLEDQGNYASRKEIFHAHWETYLTSSTYWKNWREKINSFKSEKEIHFYTDRLRAFIEFVEKNTCKAKNNYCGTAFEDLQQWDSLKTPKLLEQELKRLENISEEEFNQTDKWRKSGPVWKELSVEEMLNDKWISKEIDNIFGKNLEEGQNKKIYHQSKEEKPLTKPNNNEKLGSKQGRETNRFQEQEVQTQPKTKLQSENNWINKSLIYGGVGMIGLLGLLAIVVKFKKKK